MVVEGDVRQMHQMCQRSRMQMSLHLVGISLSQHTQIRAVRLSSAYAAQRLQQQLALGAVLC